MWGGEFVPFLPPKNGVWGPQNPPKMTFFGQKVPYWAIGSPSNPKWIEHWLNMVEHCTSHLGGWVWALFAPKKWLYGTPGAPKRARFGPKRPFFGPPEVLRGPGGPDLVPTTADWSSGIGHMVTTHFGLVSALFWAPRGPKRAIFGPKCPFWWPQRSQEGPGGPNLVPTAIGCSAWVKLMVTTHCGLV